MGLSIPFRTLRWSKNAGVIFVRVRRPAAPLIRG
jgi:hypothetical protein